MVTGVRPVVHKDNPGSITGTGGAGPSISGPTSVADVTTGCIGEILGTIILNVINPRHCIYVQVIMNTVIFSKTIVIMIIRIRHSRISQRFPERFLYFNVKLFIRTTQKKKKRS